MNISNTVQLTMKTKISLILAFSTLVSCDEVCENGEGDLFWIDNPVISYTITDAEVSPIGSFEQELLVDDHNYTLQIKVPPPSSPYRAYYKEGFKSNDKIEINPKMMLQLIGLYAFKDFDLLRTFGYQPRKAYVGSNDDDTCYYYKCDASVNNVNCNLTSSTPSCELKWGISRYPNDFKRQDGRNWLFLGQCQMKMTTVKGNIFQIWLGLAFSKRRPIITVLKNAIELDWKMNATLFPKGNST